MALVVLLADNKKKYISTCGNLFTTKFPKWQRKNLRNDAEYWMPDIEIEKMVKISNWELVKDFTAVQASGDYKVEQLYHATDAQNLYPIAQNNFDLSKIVRTYYGNGMSFSGDCDYCNRHCNNENGKNRVLIVCDVLVGNSKIVKPHPEPNVPSDGVDTYISQDGKVYVKFNMRHVYPKYAIHYYEEIDDSEEYDNYYDGPDYSYDGPNYDYDGPDYAGPDYAGPDYTGPDYVYGGPDYAYGGDSAYASGNVEFAYDFAANIINNSGDNYY